MVLDTAELLYMGGVCPLPLRIYTGLLGQIGDVIMFSATVRRIKQIFPNSSITFAVSERYRQAGELLAGLPYIDKLFITELYFEKLAPERVPLFEAGWPLELRGDDEIEEQKHYDLVFNTRPRCRRRPWWRYGHLVEELAHRAGVPGPIDIRTEIVIPPGTTAPCDAHNKIILHNDASIDPRKGWSWEYVREVVRSLPDGSVILVGTHGEVVPGVLDMRGLTTLAQTAALIAQCKCYVGVESGPMCIAGSLQVPAIGLYGTEYVPAYSAVYPYNPNALYLQAEGSVRNIPPGAVLAALGDMEARRQQHEAGGYV